MQSDLGGLPNIFFFLKNSFIGVKEHTIYYMHLKRRNFISFDIRIYPWNHHCSEDTEYPLNPQTLLCALGGPHHCRSNHWSAFCRYRNLSGIWPILYRCKCKQRNLPPPPGSYFMGFDKRVKGLWESNINHCIIPSSSVISSTCICWASTRYGHHYQELVKQQWTK